MSKASAAEIEDESLRDTIARVATQLFAQKGYRGTSLREVAEAAGCTKPALYYYFDSKESLYQKMVTEALTRMSSIAMMVTQADGAFEDRLMSGFDTLHAAIEADPDGLRLLHRAEMLPEPGRPDINLDQARAAQLAIIESFVKAGVAQGVLRADLNPRDAAVILTSVVRFHVQMWISGADDHGKDDLKRVIALCFLGIGANQ